ncbi:MAG TPA: hypothetical protein VHW93_01540 [Acidimicrobiales bacterium]|nr:hypothetical protein [Acidimicrobiales bacterium]
MSAVAFSMVTATAGATAATTVAGPGATAVPATASDPAPSIRPAVTSALSSSSFVETWSTGHLPDDGGPVAMSSPIPVTLGGQASVVVGDRFGDVYAFRLGGSSAAAVPGWPATNESGPIDSTPSIADIGGQPSVLVGSGDDGDPIPGGYTAYGPSGDEQWFTSVVNPASDDVPFGGVQAGLAVGSLQSGGLDAVAGSLGQVSYALDASDGSPLTGWPFLNTDSTHSTAALADLYGTGQNEIIYGSDQTGGVGAGQDYSDGGHLRIVSAQGNEICRADTNQTVDSSPAVGGFLSGGATGIVVGTGSFFASASDTDTLKAYNNRCQLQWSTLLDGSTFSSPALSDVLGNGSFQVVEGTDLGTGGSVWVLNAATGQKVWEVSGISRVIGSVVTADLGDVGYDDVIVPTIHGTLVLDGKTGAQVADLSPNLGLQNSPLITDDPDGEIGITLAGYTSSTLSPDGVGEIDHYEISGSNGSEAVGGSAWPMFHHDPQLTGNAGGTTPIGSIPPCSVPSAAYSGYDLAASDGGVFTFGSMPFCGSTGGIRLAAPVVGMAMAASSGGYWEVASDGGVFAFGGAPFYGSMGGQHLNAPIVGMAATPDGGGYWLVASDGGIFSFGDASFLGSMGGKHLNSPVVGMSSSSDGAGYRLVAADGGIFTFGDAPFAGSEGSHHLNRPVVGTTNDINTGGYWEVASDGGVFSFGGAPFYGSTGNIPLNAPIVGMAEASDGSGYRFGAADGGVFSFSAPFLGSMGGTPLARPVVGMAGF